MENKNYEWVELPSKGQCYPANSPLREGKVKVSYLTAMDGQLSNAQNGGRGSLPIGIGNVLNPSEYFTVSQIFSTFALPFGLIPGGRHIIGSAFRIFIPLSETSTTSINMTGMRIGSTPLTCIFKCLIYCQGEAKFYLNVILAVEGHTQE